jgi:lipoprotein-releasing system ATP-binding protein
MIEDSMTNSAPQPPVLLLDQVTRSFRQGGETLEVLKGGRLAIAPGQIVALVGPSGSGKSTLLQIAGLLEPPTSGQVVVAGTDASRASEAERTRLRRDHLGFVYQFHHLLPEFTALENVAMPRIIQGASKGSAETRARQLLTDMGLEHRLDHRPARLSGGEQQRVAIARALANDPALLLADEPTGNLDPDTGHRVFDLLMQAARHHGLSALIATHNLDMAAHMDRRVTLQDGVLVEL